MEVKNKKIHKAKVKEINKTANNMFLLKLDTNSVREVHPGQFISILCKEHTLRRPFSVYDFNPEVGELKICFKIKGDATKYLSSLKPGDSIDFIGPVGNNFSISDKKSLVLGAGVGFAPVFYLAKHLKNVFKVAAFMTKNEIPTDLHSDMIITNDGTAGKKGSLLDYLDYLKDKIKPEIIYACGPSIVLKKISEFGEKYEINTEIAMENLMACSVGVCRGCVIKVKKNGVISNASVCKDGPVFNGGEIVWE